MRLLHGPGTYAALNDTQQFVDEMNATALNAGGGFANYADWRLPNISIPDVPDVALFSFKLRVDNKTFSLNTHS